MDQNAEKIPLRLKFLYFWEQILVSLIFLLNVLLDIIFNFPSHYESIGPTAGGKVLESNLSNPAWKELCHHLHCHLERNLSMLIKFLHYPILISHVSV